MPTISGFGGNQAQMEAVYKKGLQIIEQVAKDFDNLKSRNAFDTIIGDSATGGRDALRAAETVLKDTLDVMARRIKTPSFKIIYDDTLDPGAAHAWMMSLQEEDVFGQKAPHRIWNVKEVASEVDRMRSGQTGPKFSGGKLDEQLPLAIGSGFFALPMRHLRHQCQVGVFLHELSHHAAATKDDDQGGPCYDWVGVQNIRSKGPAYAVRNAENVSYYCLWATFVV
jgi:hypothetical protein